MEELHPDLVLMDIYLGDSDGRVLCKQLKSSKEFGLVPIILYSAGYIANSSIRDSMADDFLVKPFDIKQLLAKISTALKDVSSN
jgi:DNA-binding response OmpR family regulator